MYKVMASIRFKQAIWTTELKTTNYRKCWNIMDLLFNSNTVVVLFYFLFRFFLVIIKSVNIFDSDLTFS